jgi:ribonuclease HI
MRDVTIVTDGSCIGNPGPGGWTCILPCGEQERELSGGDQETTSKRMELMAALEGLRALKVPCRVHLVSDSPYLKKGITTFLLRWKSNGWVKFNGEPVLNQDPWDQFDQIAQKHEIQWEWTAGHGDHADQNRADQLALQAARSRAAQGAR